MRQTILLLCCLGVSGLASPAFAAVVIFNDYTDAQVYDGTNSADAAYSNTGGTFAIATLPGYSSSTSTVYLIAGNSASFSGLFSHERQGTYLGYSYSQMNVDFTIAVDSTYTASGSYVNRSGHTLLASYLYDGNVNAYAYNSVQESIGGLGAFSLGGSDGNASNTFTGSLTGLLLAGHTYSWSAIALTQAYPDPDTETPANGGVSLSITPIPEHSSAIVWSLLALTIGGAGWWQRSKLAPE